MTDTEKKLVKEGVVSIFDNFNILEHTACLGELRDDILRLINSMPEEPVSDKFEKLKKLADAMYYAAQQLTTDASRLHKAMDEYHKFIVHEYIEEPEYLEEETKYCAFSTSRYTDKERKVLCDGCEEECRFNKKEDSVSESLNDYAKEILSWEDSNEEWDRLVIRKTAKHFTDWQKEQMMAKAVDATVHSDAGGYPYIPQIELYDYDKDVPLAKEGDKYKVILIKED